MNEDKEEQHLSPLVVSMLTLLIAGGVAVGADFLNNAVNYGAQPAPEPLEIVRGDEAGLRFSPARAKRRAGFFLRRQGDLETLTEAERQAAEEAAEDSQAAGEKAAPADEAVSSHSENSGSASSASSAGGFGTAEGASGEAEDAFGPSSSIDGIKLSGIMVGSGVGVAVFESGGSTQSLSVNQNIGGYKICEILSDRVVLERGGRRTVLGLRSSSGSADSSDSGGFKNGHPVLPNPADVQEPPKPSSSGSSYAASVRPSAVNSVPSDRDFAPPVPNKVDVYNLAAGGAKSGQTSSSERSSSKLENVPGAAPTPMPPSKEELAALAGRGAAMFAEVRAVPDADGTGVRLKIGPDSVMRRMGLKDGDVVTRINNKAVLSSEEFYNSLLNMSEMPFVNIEYKRQGKAGSIVYDL